MDSDIDPPMSPEAMAALSPTEFESLIAKWLQSLGWAAKTTSRSHDGGVDVVAVNPDLLTGGTYLVQCKKYAPENVVGAAAIREFYGVVMDQAASRGLFVTTSRFSGDAEDFARGKPIALVDGATLISLLADAGIIRASGASAEKEPSAPYELLDFAWQIRHSAPQHAERICADIVRDDASMADAWLLLGHIQGDQDRYAQAIDSYGRGLNVTTSRSEKYELLCALGIMWTRRLSEEAITSQQGTEYFKIAEAHLLNAIELCPYRRPPSAVAHLNTLYHLVDFRMAVGRGSPKHTVPSCRLPHGGGTGALARLC